MWIFLDCGILIHLCAGQDQTVIGRAAVAAARIAEEGKAPSAFWTLEQADIVRLGREEWKD
jgi:hypothetical protein